MTAQQPTAPRVLRRRSDDRVLAGVASGLGDYFNVDPLLVRIVFVGLMVFGGSGLFLYLISWLLIPDERTGTSVAERFFRGGGRVVLWLLLILAGLALIAGIGGFGVGGFGGDFNAIVVGAVLIIALGAFLLRNEPDGASGQASGATVTGQSIPAGTDVAPAPVAVRRPPRPPSPLGWYVAGAALIGVGALAVVQNVTGAAIDLGQYFGLALGILGIGLLIGAFWGRARWLILVGLLILPFAWMASLISVPLEGGWGTYRYSPATGEQLLDEYRLVGGQIRLDLTDVERTTDPIDVAASVGVGEIRVLLPDDADLELDAAVGGGVLRVLGESQDGTRLEEHATLDGNGQSFVLDVEAGWGTVVVETRRTGGSE
jgi:phage shock protein PspC (stress-responsive transcriptional regulator)